MSNPALAVAFLGVLTFSLLVPDSGITIDGVRFYGSPWTPEFYGWGFNAERGDEIAAIWRRIPTETDVLITHGPPVGIGDACFDGQRAGCVDLLREIETRVCPLPFLRFIFLLFRLR